jgi:hypothetical protein
VNSFMTDAGLTLLWAWWDKRGAAACEALASAGKGAIKTLKADGGTCAWRKIFKMPGGRSAWGARAVGAAFSCEAVVVMASAVGAAWDAPKAAKSKAPRPHDLGLVQGEKGRVKVMG